MAFQQTVVHVERSNATWQISPAPIDVTGAYFPEETGPFHILTAHNPQGIAASIAANTTAHGRLATYLAALELAHVWPATGTDAAGVWAEEGFMVGGLTRLVGAAAVSGTAASGAAVSGTDVLGTAWPYGSPVIVVPSKLSAI